MRLLARLGLLAGTLLQLGCAGNSTEALEPTPPQASQAPQAPQAPMAIDAGASSIADQCKDVSPIPEEEEEGKWGDGGDLAERIAGCEKGKAYDCKRSSQIYEQGWGIAADAAKAAVYEEATTRAYTKECDRGCLGQPCFRLGFYYLKIKRDPKGAEFFEQAAAIYARQCQADIATSCGSLAHLRGGGWGIEADEELAKQLRTKACALGHLASCPKPSN